MKVIVVPPAQLPIPNMKTMVESNETLVGLNGNPVFPFVRIDYMPHPVDPILSYLQWYGRDHTIPHRMEDYSFHNKFWRVRELHDWLDANMSDYVLVQRDPSNTAWTFHFVGGYPDETKMTKWLNTIEAKYRFDIPTQVASRSDLQKWINENVRGEYRIFSHGPATCVRIRNEMEAVHFKMTWVGAENIQNV